MASDVCIDKATQTNYMILIPLHQIYDGLYNYFHVVKVTWPVEKNTAAQMGYSSKLVTKEKGIILVAVQIHAQCRVVKS